MSLLSLIFNPVAFGCMCMCARSYLALCDSVDSCQAPLSMEFPKQECWRWGRLPFPTPGDLPDLGIEPASHVSCIGKQILYH